MRNRGARRTFVRSLNKRKSDAAVLTLLPLYALGFRQRRPYEVHAFPWSGLAPCACACASDM
jgi:hypothetical protein